jgi:dethiobiotin synthetase
VATKKVLRLEIDEMTNAFKAIQNHADCIVVDGAGGFLVPLNNDEDFGEFAKQIHLLIILVVGMKLGCLNHALLSYEAIKARGLPLVGWVANTLSVEMLLLRGNIGC